MAFLFIIPLPFATATTYKTLYSFANGQDGGIPSSGVTFDAKGNLFGTTYQGGPSKEGVVYELSPNKDGTWTESVVHSFVYSEGDVPAEGVIIDSSGNLYGSTTSGGPDRIGTVFELSPDGGAWMLNLIYDSIGGPFVFDSAGSLYGSLGEGDNLAGAIGELSPAPDLWSYTLLHSFCAHRPQCSDGIQPQGPLAWDSAGNLYGNTIHGGIYKYPTPCADDQGCGLVFQMRPRPDGTWSYRILHWFGSFVGDGLLLNGGLLVDDQGNVYRSTGVGGPSGTGTVFELSPRPTGRKGQSIVYSEAQLYTFPNCSQGCGPFDVLTRDSAGNLYGAAGGGNTSCGGYCGVVYRLSPQRDGTWKYNLLHAFTGSDGAGPYGVTVGADGNIYGATIAGGTYNHGVVFEITP